MNPSRTEIFNDILDELADGETDRANLCLGFFSYVP